MHLSVSRDLQRCRAKPPAKCLSKQLHLASLPQRGQISIARMRAPKPTEPPTEKGCKIHPALPRQVQVPAKLWTIQPSRASTQNLKHQHRLHLEYVLSSPLRRWLVFQLPQSQFHCELQVWANPQDSRMSRKSRSWHHPQPRPKLWPQEPRRQLDKPELKLVKAAMRARQGAPRAIAIGAILLLVRSDQDANCAGSSHPQQRTARRLAQRGL